MRCCRILIVHALYFNLVFSVNYPDNDCLPKYLSLHYSTISNSMNSVWKMYIYSKVLAPQSESSSKTPGQSVSQWAVSELWVSVNKKSKTTFENLWDSGTLRTSRIPNKTAELLNLWFSCLIKTPPLCIEFMLLKCQLDNM